MRAGNLILSLIEFLSKIKSDNKFFVQRSMRLMFGVLSLTCGILSLLLIVHMVWVIHSAFDQMTTNGTTEILMVTGYLPIAISLIILGLIFGLFMFKRKNRLGRALSLIGILSSIASLIVMIVTLL